MICAPVSNAHRKYWLANTGSPHSQIQRFSVTSEASELEETVYQGFDIVRHYTG